MSERQYCTALRLLWSSLFPVIFRFDENDNNTYRLVGVAQHIGDRDGGHYSVYVRANKMNGQEHQSNDKSWFYASDEMIREASLQDVLDCEAYILFHERVGN